MVGPILIAVASYNHAPYVEAAIASLIEQTYEHLELCWIDDSSTDGTFERVCEIIEDLDAKKRFSNIWLRKNGKNMGAHFSLNAAARHGSSRLISFLNSDDIYAADRLKKISSYDRGEPHFLGFSGVASINADGGYGAREAVATAIDVELREWILRFPRISQAFLGRQVTASTGNIVVSRSLFEALGGFQNLRYCHDWMFTLNSTLFCEPVFIPDDLYLYRLHDSNSFRSLSGVAEFETDLVRSTYFRAMYCAEPLNRDLLTFRNSPAEWRSMLLDLGITDDFARITHPYPRDSRLLDLDKRLEA